MEIVNVPALSIAGMIFSLLISVGVPALLAYLAYKKLRASIKSMFVGAVTFIVFALILEQIFHVVMGNVFDDALTNNIWIRGVYGGLAAGVFEEIGRYLAMKFVIKNDLSKENSIMYGVGHGGIEAIIIAGLAAASNIVVSVLINTGRFEATLSTLTDEVREQTITQISALWTSPSYVFFLSGIERLSAIAIHICFSYLVYLAVKNKKVFFFFIAILLHAIFDFSAVVLAELSTAIVVEIVLIVMAGLLSFIVYTKYKKEQ